MIMTKVKTPALYVHQSWDEEKKEYLKEVREVEVGQGCTVTVGSDAYPYHVSRISDSGKTVWIKRAHFSAAPGSDYFGDQKWIITPRPEAREEAVRKRKFGGWTTTSGCRVTFGVCVAHQDPHF